MSPQDQEQELTKAMGCCDDVVRDEGSPKGCEEELLLLMRRLSRLAAPAQEQELTKAMGCCDAESLVMVWCVMRGVRRGAKSLSSSS